MSRPKQFIADLKKYSDKRNPADIEFMKHFFKTGLGQYAEGDVPMGVRVPEIRIVCKKYADLSLAEIEELLESPLHEVREGAAIIMANQSVKTKDVDLKKALFDLYIRRTDRINNWDIVDCSCRDVVGGYLLDKPRDILYKLAKSSNLWERRIAMVSTWQFIRKGDLRDTFKIAKMLLNDKQDLIHKATGWMLRSAGDKDPAALLEFLDKYAATMPRTALRYALEHLSIEQKAFYMRQKTDRLSA